MYNSIAKRKISELKESGQYRTFIDIDRINGRYPHGCTSTKGLETGNNKIVTIWCSNDYLGLSQHPEIVETTVSTIIKHGVGSGGSRNISGTSSYFNELEKKLATWHGKEAALIFPTGYSSNQSTIQTLAKLFPNAIILSDELNHASIIDGISSSKIEKKIFNHNDVQHLEILLKNEPLDRPKIIIFESIYSMDGDISPIKEIVELSKRYNGFTFIDEVHAIGLYGANGAGIASSLNINSEINIIQGTMAKGIGVIGGYIAGNSQIIDAIRSLASGFIFTTALPPAIISACSKSIDIITRNDQERVTLQIKTKELRHLFSEYNIPVMKKSTTHILPVLIGDSIKCKKAADYMLEEHNIYIQPINSPTVPEGTERFRINVTPNHTRNDMIKLSKALAEVFSYFNIPFKNED